MDFKVEEIIEVVFITPDGLKRNKSGKLVNELAVLPVNLKSKHLNKKELIAVANSDNDDIRLAIVFNTNISNDEKTKIENIKNKVLYVPDNKHDSLVQAVKKMALASGRIKPSLGDE